MPPQPDQSRSAATLSERERKALIVLADHGGPMWPGRVGILAGDDRPSWRVGHAWRNTLFALERKRLVRGISKRGSGACSHHTDFQITKEGRAVVR